MVPTVTNIRRRNGVAGQFQLSATVQYPDEPASIIVFVGSVYGPPITMITPSGAQVFVSDRVLDRIGRTLNPEWVRQFFATNYGST